MMLCSFEQILEATPYKTAVIGLFISRLQVLEKKEQTYKKCSCMDPLHKGTHTRVLTNQQKLIFVSSVQT